MMEATRIIGTSDAPGASLRLVVPPRPEYARYVRQRVAAFTDANGVPERDADDFLMALSEAVANAIEHGGSQRKIETSCWLVAGERLIATVVDSGVGFPSPDAALVAAAVPDPLAERGRGLSIMQRCTDHCAIRSIPGKGTAVILTRYVARPHLHSVAAAGG